MLDDSRGVVFFLATTRIMNEHSIATVVCIAESSKVKHDGGAETAKAVIARRQVPRPKIGMGSSTRTTKRGNIERIVVNAANDLPKFNRTTDESLF